MQKFLIAAMIVASLAFAGGAVLAQGLPPAVIAVLDIQLIHRESIAGKDIVVQLERYRASYQTEITKDEESLRNQEQELARQRTILTPDAFAERQRQFQQRVADVQRKVQERSRQLDRSHAVARNELGRVVRLIVDQVSKTRQFNLVLDREQVPYVHTSLDITDIVMEELNKRHPKIAVPPPDKS